MGKKLIDLDKLEKLSKALDSRANATIKAETQRALAAEQSLQTAINGKAASGHTHDDRYYTESEINTKVTNLQAEIDADVKVEADRAKAAEQDLQANIDKKANASHGNHVPTTQTANNSVFLRNDNTWATVTPANIGASATGHTHDDKYYTEAEIDAKITTLNNSINGKAASGHTHDERYYTEDEIDDKVEDLQAEIDADVLVETNRAKGVENSLQAAINGKAPMSHSHGDLYYTEDEIDDKVADLQAEIDADVLTETNRAKGIENALDAAIKTKADSGHLHDGRYYTEAEVDEIVEGIQAEIDADVKVEADRAKAAEQDLQANIDKKANASHGNHVPTTQTANNKVFLRNDNTWATITPANIGAAASVHSHDDLYYTETEIDSKVTTLNGLIDGKANKSHGNHVPATQTANNAVFLRNDNTWQTVTPDNIGAAKASHGTHVTYATVAPKANGTAAIGSSGKVAREDHVHPLQTEVSGNAGSADVLSTPRNITIGNQTNAFDGSENITYTLSEIGASAEGHNHDGRYYTESEINTKVSSLQAEIDADVKVEADRAKAAENALQANIDKKSNSSHTHTNFAIKLNGGTTEGTNLFTYNGGTAKTVNITPSGIGASATGHTHDDRYFTETEMNAKITTINNSIATAKSDAQAYADTQIAALVDSAPDAMNTLNELADAISDHQDVYDAYVQEVSSKLSGKSDTGHTHNYAGSSSAGGAATSANKVNTNLVIKLNSGSTEGTNLFTFNGSSAKTINITPDGIGAAKSSHGTHVTYASAAPLANGTAAVGSSSKVAREDHVHPLQTTISGNAGSADKAGKWTTARTITIGNTGKEVDGSANVSWTLTEIGAAAASHGTHLTLGTGSGNAYYGDKGKVAYDHSQAAHAPSNAQKNSDITKAEIEARLTGTITSHNHTTLQEESLANKTLSLNDLTLSDGATHIKHYYCPSDGGGSNITGRPSDSSKQAFNLKVELVRWASSTDYITKQTYTQGSTKQMHVRYCTNGTWSAWEKVYTSAQKPTLSELGAAASSHGTHVTYASAAPLANGTAAVGSSSKVAREDHVHPLQTTISGNAGSADKASKWTTARTLTIGNSGKSVDGSANVSWTLSEIGAATSGHTHNSLVSRGNVTAETTTNRPAVGGLSMSCAYSNGYPTPYGNVMTMKGSGDGQLLIGWSGTSGAHAPAYIRSKRDNSDANWSDWAQIYTTAHKPTYSDVGAAAASHGTHVTWATATPKANGTAAIGSVDRVAREDHVHPIQTTVSGNAGTASKWAAPITLTIGNKGKTVDGSGNVSWTLAEMGASASGHTHNYAGSSSAGGAANSVANSVKVQLNGGTTEGTNQFTFNGSAAKTINITPSSIGAAASSHGTHVTYASAAPLANGTAAVGSSSKVAREDHVHPLQTSVSGNAGTATKLATARTITVNGIVSGSASFDGSANVTITTAANDITSIEKSLTVGTDWMDTGISGSNLATGTYAVQMYADTQGTGGLWTEYFSGIMSWYSANTNSTDADEIALHKAGHSSNGQHIYLRTKRNSNGVLVLQIAAKTAITTAIKFKFKFKKLI